MGPAVVHARQLPLPFGDAPLGAAPARLGSVEPVPVLRAADVDLGSEDADRLRERFAAAFGRPVRLVLTQNRSTMLSLSRRSHPPTLRAHRMFLEANVEVVRAAAAWLRRGDRQAARTLDAFFRAKRAAASAATVVPARPLRLRQAGRYFHLGRLFADLNARYFEGKVSARITWGQAGKRGWRRTIKLGSYTRDERIIRIHPALDRAFVPRFFIESVVHHEMVHAIIDAPVVRGRRRHHGAEFRRLERTFADHARALAWERANLNRILQRR